MQLRQLVRVFQAFGDPTRLRILSLLSAQPGLNVTAITDALELPQSTVSRQLAQLRASGVVEDQREGRFIHYFLGSGGLLEKRYLPAALLFARSSTPELKADLRKLAAVLKAQGS